MKDKEMKKKRLPQGAVIAILAAVLVMSVIGSVVLGRYPIGFRELCGIVGSKFMDIKPFWKPVQESLLLNHRLPRILLSCMVGACLSSAGAAYQGVFQNPMAAPDILGASNGAAFGGVCYCRERQVLIDPSDLDMLNIQTAIFDDRWEIDYRIPVALIQKYIPTYHHATGARLCGNFYKCGDETGHPHFACFSNIAWEHPDYHRPEFFAEFVLN